MRQAISRSIVVSAIAGALLVLWTAEGRAEQFILFDATFDYTWDDAMNSRPSKSHFYVNNNNFLNKDRPANWLSPVDYRNGTLHVRAEVFSKPPGTQTTGWTLCYIPNAGGYGCADTDYYRSTGVFEREVKMTSWWNNNQLQWDKGVKQMDLIYAINDSGSGHVTNYPNLKDLTTPTRVRITMVQVSSGSTYDPKIIPGVSPGPSDGGAGGGSGDAGTRDAGEPVEGGSGGSTGTGGATATGTGGSGGGTTPPASSTGGAPGSPAGTGGTPGVTPPTSGPQGGSVAGGCATAPANAAGWFTPAAALAAGLIAVAAGRRRRNRR